MNENETIDDLITYFTKITNGRSSLGNSIDNDQKVRRVIQAIPQSWKVKSTTLKELNDKEEMDFMGLIDYLKTYEMKRKVEKTRDHKRRRLLHSKPLLPSSMMMKSLSKMMIKNSPY